MAALGARSGLVRARNAFKCGGGYEKVAGVCRGPSVSLLSCTFPARSLALQAAPLPGSQALVRDKRAFTGEATASGAGGGVNTQDREILVQHALVKEDQLQLLLDIQRKILAEGEDLADLAAEHSICPSARQGGMLGWIEKGRTVPEFEEAAFSAPLNKPVRVKTKHGWHLLQVLQERPAGFLRPIEPAELASNLGRDDVQLIDVREPNEIEIAAIQGFKAYPLSEFGNWAPTITEQLDLAKDTYVLCHHGVRSMQAAQWLKSQGFKRVYNVSGGIHAYSLQVDTSVPKY